MRAALLPLCLLVGTAARAQELRFRTIGTADGLRDNGITCLLEDREGFLWIGTEGGLHRFDGNLVLPVPGATDPVSALAQDRQGRIWAGTVGNGLLCVRNGRAEHPILTDGDSGTARPGRIHQLHPLPDGRILLAGSPVALSVLDPDRGTLAPWNLVSTQPIASGETWCHAIVPVDSNTLWLGMLHQGRSFLVDLRDRQVLQVLQQGQEKGPNATASRAAVLQGLLYTAGWQPGIERHRLSDGARLPDWTTPDETADLCVWNGRLVVATKRSGLLLFDPATGNGTAIRHLSGTMDGLPGDRVRCLLADRHGRLWVGTGAGLALHTPAAWPFHTRQLVTDGPGDLEVYALDPLPDGRVRVLSSAGLHSLSVDGGPVPHPAPGGLVFTRCSPPMNGRCLVGTETGLRIVDATTLKPVGPFERHMGSLHIGGLEQQYQVRGVYPDRLHGQAVWVVGALGYGIQVWRDRDGEVLIPTILDTLRNGTALALLHDLRRDRHGNYWAATDGGVLRYSLTNDAVMVHDHHGGTWLHLARALDIHGDMVRAVLRDGVLVTLVHDRIIALSNSPTSARFLGLATDRAGRSWITTSAGLERHDPGTKTWMRLPISGSAGSGPMHGPITLLDDSTLVFAYGDQLMCFDPRVLDGLPDLPAPFLVDATSGGRALDLRNGRLELEHGQGVLDLRVSALMHDMPLPLRFSYRLDGAETDRRTAAAGELVRYAGLPVGTHTWLVRAVDAYGREGPEVRLVTVQVAGPLWQRWWFFALAAVLISLVVYGWSRHRLAQALRLEAMRNRIAGDLHDEVGSSLSSITIGAKLAAQLSAGEDPRVRELLARIGETSSESLRSISDIVWAIDPRNDHGEALVTRMRRIANELLESKGIEVSFSVSGGVEGLKLPMDVRKELVLLYKEAVHNASKYSSAKLVQVSLHRRPHGDAGGSLALSVKDDGLGFDPALHPDGHGLGGMQQRARQLGASLILRSAPGLGTLVGVEVGLPGTRS